MRKHITRLCVGAFALLFTALYSCKNGCYTCDCSSVGDTNAHIVCDDDYGSQDEFKAGLDYYESIGCPCKKK